MIRWLRLVLPPEGYLILTAVFYAGSEGTLLLTEARFGAGWRAPAPRPSLLVLVIALVAYAIYRVTAFHPLRTGYGKWLAATPWTSRKPLPLGPVHFAGQDLLLVGAALLIGWPSHGMDLLLVLNAFLFCYVGTLLICLSLSGEGMCAYALAFGLGLVVRLWPDRGLGFLVLVLLYGLAQAGLRRSLTRFPWRTETAGPTSEWWQAQTEGVDPTFAHVGWPFGAAGPKFDYLQQISLRHAVLVSLLAGWWTYATTSLIREEEARLGICMFLLTLAGGFVPLIRLPVYGQGYAPPITLAGRLRTGRWLIHGYDQVFVAPFLAVWTAAAGALICLFFQIEPAIGLSLTLTLSLMIALGLGPDLKSWRLTGDHRIVSANRKGLIEVG